MTDDVRLWEDPQEEPVVVQPESHAAAETVAGTAIGTAAGAAVGAAVGAIGGPVGAVAGAVLGGLGGGAAGAAVSADDGTVPTTTTPITGNAGYGADVDTGITGVGITPRREVP
jgi:hypothetical protein